MDSEVLEVLKEIRDGLSEIRDGVLREIRDGVREMNARLDSIDGRLDSIDGRLATITGRLDSIDGRLQFVEKRLTNGFGELSQKIDKLTREQMGGFVSIEGVLGRVHAALINNVALLDHERRLAAIEKQHG